MKMKGALKVFGQSLNEYGDDGGEPVDWFDAFSRLRKILSGKNVYRDPVSGRRVVFLDELPWMDTARSDFKSALDYFWNSWGSAQEDLMLIVCGSAASWIIKHILTNTGGLYNRITRQLHLGPFTLKECRQLFENRGIVISDRQIVESYMVFGGVPYYMDCFDKRLSLAQNINSLCFLENGQLHDEYKRMFQSLFKHAEQHLEVVEILAKKRSGLTRNEIAETENISRGEGLTTILSELEQCGFIRKYKTFGKEKRDALYQITDPFTLFCLNFMNRSDIQSWMSFINTPAYYAWRGNAFEIVCLNHIEQIKKCLGIAGIETREYSWKSAASEPGVQIDLIIDRRDEVMNICEMKYTDDEYSISKEYENNLLHKAAVFRAETGTRKSMYLTMISANGLKRNEHAGIIQNVITAEDLMN